jgi:hypothetical protein
MIKSPRVCPRRGFSDRGNRDAFAAALQVARSLLREIPFLTETLFLFQDPNSGLASGGVHRMGTILVEKVFGVLSGVFPRPARPPEDDFGRAFSLQDVVPDFFRWGATIHKDVSVEVSDRDSIGTHGANFRDQ